MSVARVLTKDDFAEMSEKIDGVVTAFANLKSCVMTCFEVEPMLLMSLFKDDLMQRLPLALATCKHLAKQRLQHFDELASMGVEEKYVQLMKRDVAEAIAFATVRTPGQPPVPPEVLNAILTAANAAGLYDTTRRAPATPSTPPNVVNSSATRSTGDRRTRPETLGEHENDGGVNELD